MVGEATCCSDATVAGLRKIMKKINSKAPEQKTLIERFVASLPVVLKGCGTKDGVNVPKNARDFLEQYKVGEVTGK